MPYNGAGSFTRVYNWVSDAAAAIPITASRVDTEDDGFATGLSTAICKDGQTVISANLPMAGFRHTGVGNASAANHYGVVSQIQNSSYTWVAGGGTADAITATYSPAVTTLTDGMELDFRASGSNTTTTPTFSPNGLTARTITKRGGSALAVGDIPAALAECILRYNLANTRWELLNPVGTSGTVTTSGSPANGNLAKFSSSTAVTNADLTGDITTSGGVATTLATVNSNVGSFTNASVTVNAKGLVTAASSGAAVITKGSALTKNPYAVSSTTQQAHGLASIPNLFFAYLECLSTELGYSVGDRVNVNGGIMGGFSSNCIATINADSTNVNLTTSSATPYINQKTTGGDGTQITAAKWKLVVTPAVM